MPGRSKKSEAQGVQDQLRNLQHQIDVLQGEIVILRQQIHSVASRPDPYRPIGPGPGRSPWQPVVPDPIKPTPPWYEDEVHRPLRIMMVEHDGR